MWDPARLFENDGEPARSRSTETHEAERSSALDTPSEAIDLRTQAIDLRTSPLSPLHSPDDDADPSPPARPGSGQPRRRALLAEYRQSQSHAVHSPVPSIADALRELNEQRVNGLISEESFKAKQAELFSSRAAASDTSPDRRPPER